MTHTLYVRYPAEGIVNVELADSPAIYNLGLGLNYGKLQYDML